MTVMEERFELASQRILEIEKEKRMPEQFQRYFAENADYLGVLLEEYKWIASGAMREASLQELERHNESCFIDLMGRNYETSYANPDWAYAQLGETFGQLLSAVAAELRSLPAFIYEQDLEGITIRLELFVEIYCAFAESFEETKEAPEYSQIRDIFYWFASDYAELTAEHAIRHTVDWGQRFALDIIENAKASRPSVCNAEEALLVHRDVAAQFLPMLKQRLVDDRTAAGLTPVELHLDARAAAIIDGVPAAPADFDTEYLDYKLSVAVVDTLDDAIAHIAKHSTHHSEAIVTRSPEAERYFTANVDSAAVYVNASTRFTDGGEFGFGAEIGISTQKLHARGPLGLPQLTSFKYEIFGNGQIR